MRLSEFDKEPRTLDYGFTVNYIGYINKFEVRGPKPQNRFIMRFRGTVAGRREATKFAYACGLGYEASQYEIFAKGKVA